MTGRHARLTLDAEPMPPETIAEAFASIEANLRALHRAVENNPRASLDVLVRLIRLNERLRGLYRAVRPAGTSDDTPPDGGKVA